MLNYIEREPPGGAVTEAKHMTSMIDTTNATQDLVIAAQDLCDYAAQNGIANLCFDTSTSKLYLVPTCGIEIHVAEAGTTAESVLNYIINFIEVAEGESAKVKQLDEIIETIDKAYELAKVAGVNFLDFLPEELQANETSPSNKGTALFYA